MHGSNSGSWLEAWLRYALAETRSHRPFGAGVLAKLVKLLFIEVLRPYTNEQTGGCTGWLAGVGDRIVGGALSAIQLSPARLWTLDDLVLTASSSRSVPAERFEHLAGNSPI